MTSACRPAHRLIGRPNAGPALMLAMVLAAVLLPVAKARAQDSALNGSSPRPFYVFGHNPNTIEDATTVLAAGANALEPDVQVGSSLELVVAHGPNEPGHMTVVDYLDRLRALTFTNNLALVVFDVKSEAATKERGLELLRAIRTHLNIQGVDINVIISVATRKDGAIFDFLIGPDAQVVLGPREGVMIDEEDNAGDVVRFFVDDKHYSGNIGFGDGTAGGGGSLARAIDGAAGIRAATGLPRAVTYVYTIERRSTMTAFIDAGVDGIIPDVFPPSGKAEPGLVELLRSVVDGRSDLFVATRKDNPFLPLNEAYALQIRTSDDESLGGEGTDANLTFTLAGSLGVASVTVNTGFIVPPLLDSHRMEAGHTDWVTIPSKNLGVLKSVTISNDGSGHGADWKLQDLTVFSARWLNPDLAHDYSVAFNGFIDAHGSRALPLTPHMPALEKLTDEFVWGASDWGYADGTSRAPIKRLGDALDAVVTGGTIHVASGRYGETLRLGKPCTIRFWAEHGDTPAVLGLPE
jgi:hypothetical protein